MGFELDKYSDFFACGVDSLKAIQMRGLIIQNLDLGGKGPTLPSMLVYDCGNIERLSQKLLDFQKGSESETQDELTLMKDMVEQYSVLPNKISSQGLSAPHENVIVSIPKLKLCQIRHVRFVSCT